MLPPSLDFLPLTARPDAVRLYGDRPTRRAGSSGRRTGGAGTCCVAGRRPVSLLIFSALRQSYAAQLLLLLPSLLQAGGMPVCLSCLHARRRSLVSKSHRYKAPENAATASVIRLWSHISMPFLSYCGSRQSKRI